MNTIFITGASSGIGKATALSFADKGWRVIATMRDMRKAADWEHNDNIVVMPLDVTKPELIRQTVIETLRQYDIDVLFNNAGYGMKTPLEMATEGQILKNLYTNFIGPVQVTQAFIPHFKSRKKGLVLTTTSLAGIIAFPLDGIYGAAKRALTSMCESLYYELRPFHVAVKVLIPGATLTNFKMEPFCMDGYEEPSKRQLDYLLGGKKDFASVEESVQTVWSAVTDGEDRLHYPADAVAQKLYDEYQQMNIEDFKKYFYELLYQ